MNLKSLPTHDMIMLTHTWKNDSLLRGELYAHPLGAASCDNLNQACDELILQHRRRARMIADQARLTETLRSLHDTYIRKGRALHGYCECLADSADDPEDASAYRHLRDFLFPHGRRLLKRSYTEQVGAVVELEKCMTPEIMRLLESVQVGAQTLAELYEAWVETGMAMGACVKKRVEIQASLSREGTAAAHTNSSLVRFKWIRAAHILLSVVRGLSLTIEARERFFALLDKTLAEAARRRREAPVEDAAAEEVAAQAADEHADEAAESDSFDTGPEAGTEPAGTRSAPEPTPAAEPAPATEPVPEPAMTPTATTDPWQGSQSMPHEGPGPGELPDARRIGFEAPPPSQGR